jgi:CheY-like chemotaxis protein
MGVAVSEVKAGTIRILVVDDDPGVREAMLGVLRKQGWQAEGAMDGLDALTRLQHGRFDVIVTDVHMPRLDGLALLRQVRKMEDPLPVVVQTTLLDPSLEDLLRHAGAFCVLMKGGPVGDLVRSITEACPAFH